ncbi:hypothetical protein SALBM135S_01078 [Streptomyces alboniger]
MWPRQIGAMPKELAHFQTTAATERLEQAVKEGADAAPCQVLTGMGGVGKTQLAAYQARALWKAGQLDLLVWITAATRATVVDGYAQAASALLGCDRVTPEQAATSFLAWLEPKPGTDKCRWMIVLDDLADPDDLHHLWPPTSPHGRTVLTTRRRNAALTGAGWRQVPVDLFTTAEAVAYLSKTLATRERHDTPDQLAALADDLDHLPLALSQSAAYLIDSGLDCASYRRLLADRTIALDANLPDQLPDDQDTPVAAAWSLCLDRADEFRPVGLARPMLLLTAMLNPHGIPEAVLTSEPARRHLTTHFVVHVRPSLRSLHSRWLWRNISEQQAREALRVLHRLGLINHDAENPRQTVRVHRLVQRAVLEGVPTHHRGLLARTAADTLMAVWPDNDFDTALAEVLRDNATALTAHDEHALLKGRTHPVLFEVGHSLGNSGQLATAAAHFRHLATVGRNRSDRHEARHALAWWRGWGGDPAGAAAEFRRLRRSKSWTRGLTNLATLTAWHAFATFRGRSGDAAGAVKSLKWLLRIWTWWKVEPDHPDAFSVRHELAWWTGKAGNPAAAVAMLTGLAADQERLGADVYTSIATQYALAWWTGKAGNPEAAVEAMRRVRSRVEQMAGPDHPDLLDTRYGVAHWQGEAGDARGAAEALALVAQAQERVLGPEAPDTLRTLRDLARWRREAGLTSGEESTD